MNIEIKQVDKYINEKFLLIQISSLKDPKYLKEKIQLIDILKILKLTDTSLNFMFGYFGSEYLENISYVINKNEFFNVINFIGNFLEDNKGKNL